MAMNSELRDKITEKLGITDELLDEAGKRVAEYVKDGNVTKAINSMVAGMGGQLLEIYEANKLPALGTFIVEELVLHALRELVALGIVTDVDETPA